MEIDKKSEAVRRYENGEKWGVSTFIDEDTIIAGYGEIKHYDFEFPLPTEIIIKIYGTTSWTERFEMFEDELNS